jgi:hypothetical protein
MIDAAIDRVMHECPSRRQIHAGAEIVAAQPDHRNLEVRRADIAIFHGDRPAAVG